MKTLFSNRILLLILIFIILSYFELIKSNEFDSSISSRDNNNYIEDELVKDYFNERGIRVAVIFACSLFESRRILDMFMDDPNRTVLSKYDYFEMSKKYFYYMMHAPYNKLGVYLNYSCEFGKYIFSRSSSLRLFNERFVWLLTNNNKSLIDSLRIYNLQLDTDMLFGVVNTDHHNNGEDITLYEIYKIQDYLPVNSLYAGFWNREKRLNIVLINTKTSRRSNLQGIVIDGTAVLSQLTLNNKTKPEDNFKLLMDVTYESHLDIINRFPFIMNMNLAMMYNFTINVSYTEDWGVLQRNGMYNGMLGEIESGRTTLGLSTVIMTQDLLDRMDFSFPIWKFRPLFIFRNPRTFGTYDALLIPFSTEVWLFVICLIIFNIILLTFIKSLNSCVATNNNSNNLSTSNQSHINNSYLMKTNYTLDKILSENIVIVIGAMASQGLASCSTRIPERIILYMSLIVGMLLCTYYNSMIVTSLLQPPPPNIQSSEQLVESDIHIGITNVTYYEKYFEMSNDKLVKHIYMETIKKRGFMSPAEGMNLVKDTQFAFYGEEAAIYSIIADTFKNNEVCRLVEIELISPYYLPCPYKKSSPLKQFVNSGLHLMRERGIIMRERKQWHRQRPVCQGRNEVPSIQLETLIVAYIILSSGICLSLFIFVLEMLFYKKKLIHKVKGSYRRNIYEKTANSTNSVFNIKSN